LIAPDKDRTSVRPRIAVLNPNTNATTTRAMAAIAQAAAPGATILGVTAPFGVPLIATAAELAQAADAVEAACRTLHAQAFDGVLVAAFGDPGLAEAQRILSAPVVGMAQAGMRAAAAHGRFSVVTTTPGLMDSIARLAGNYGFGPKLASIRLAEGDLTVLMADRERLVFALEGACLEAIANDRIDAIVIGGGPLAAAARELAGKLPVPVVEPLPCAVAQVLAALRLQGT
jgi:allantoin racemase